MTAIFSLLIIVTLALVFTRVASVALKLTGVSVELARFQARSALTGVGFTTDEANAVVDHPVRRRIIATLMLLGSGGIVSAISSLVVSFVGVEQGAIWTRLGILTAGLMALWLISRSDRIERVMNYLIERALDRWTDLRVRDYVHMLHLAEEYKVGELEVSDEGWFAGRRLQELNIDKEGVHVLGITRPDGHYLGAPRGKTAIQSGDRLILYGKKEVLDELDTRRADRQGELEHQASRRREQARRDSEEDESE